MKSVNEVHLVGVATRDAKYGQGKKTSYCFCGVVTGDGKYKSFHNITGFGGVAESMRHIVKGDELEVVGRIQYDKKAIPNSELNYYEASLIADKVICLDHDTRIDEDIDGVPF
jgi:single-stranded DNA-binding protein